MGCDNEWEEQYVFVELIGMVDPDKLTFCTRNNTAVLGVDSSAPVLKLGSYAFAGAYEDSCGSMVFFEETEHQENKQLRFSSKEKDMDDWTASVVMPAAGSGIRFRSETPKQFIKVLGKPVLCYTIDCFMSIRWVTEIIVPIPVSWREEAEQLKKTYNYSKVTFIDGKDTRHRSIYAGIDAITSCSDHHIVIIHDGVRPFLKEDFVNQLCSEARKHQASGAVRTLVSTVIKSSKDGFLVESLDRREHFESHTPQAFQYGLLLRSYQKCDEDDFEHGTECLHLVKKYSGVSPKLVVGPDYLWKITHQEDLLLMETRLKGLFNNK